MRKFEDCSNLNLFGVSPTPRSRLNMWFVDLGLLWIGGETPEKHRIPNPKDLATVQSFEWQETTLEKRRKSSYTSHSKGKMEETEHPRQPLVSIPLR